MIDETSIREFGDELYTALVNQKMVEPLTDRMPDITLEDAYHISLRILEKRLSSGEKLTGKKIGITSDVVKEMFGVNQPDFGFLTDAMGCENGAEVTINGRLIQPRAEGEIAFILRTDLIGPGITEAQVLDATDYIMPCFEVVDSRVKNWQIKIQDTIADNASCGIYVLGDAKVDPRTLDLPKLGMKVFKNGKLLSEGVGEAVQGNPLSAVAWLANTLSQFGIPLKAGEVILSGSLVPPESVAPGDKMHLELDGVGSATVKFI
jgi:2-oxopent-4-enoate/cis-2-oxohex-4-enoate hydratase